VGWEGRGRHRRHQPRERAVYRLDGGEGMDVLIGGAGDDFYRLDTGPDEVVLIVA